jgi:VWFA-related protein
MFLAVFSLLTVSAFAQNPSVTSTASDDILKISTTLIQVDITVTDKKGNIVRDLNPEDFEVYENGKRQEISNFSFVSIDSKNKPSEAVVSPSVSNNKISIPIPPVKLKADQIRRTFALVVDDLGIAFENVPKVQQSLRKFINEQMQEGDLVAIIRTGSGIGALQSFTSDKRQLFAAIDKIRWNPQGRSGVETFAPIQKDTKDEIAATSKSGRTVEGADADKEFEKELDEFRNDNFSIGTLGSLNYVIRGMRDLPGRKAMMLFSEGFQLISHNKLTRIFDALRVLADMANRSSVVFYTLDPHGLQNPDMFYAQDDLSAIVPGSGVVTTTEARTNAFRDSQQSLRYLAYETGGVPFVNQNDLPQRRNAAGG